MINSISDWNEFERLVCSFIYKLNPYQISRYDGGADRGRDIVAEFKTSNKPYNVIIECKYYKSGVGKSVITPSLDWAKVHRPNLLYFWVIPYLTPDTKDYINQFELQYGISVLYEEGINIEQYFSHINDDTHEIWYTLRNKVLDACKKNHTLPFGFYLGNDVPNIAEIPYMVDREDERKTLANSSKCAFYIQGISASGKTQLLKYLSHIYKQEKKYVFWYTFRPETEEIQCHSFFQTLAHYFATVHNDTKLILYFQEYGYSLSRDLEDLIIYLLTRYSPIIFLDDVHNCAHSNVSLISLFENIIGTRVCKIYFAGWINIFSSKIIIKQNLHVMILDGLKAIHLNQIISHYCGHDNLTVADIIAERFHGLPGYAVLVNENTSVSDLDNDKQFLHNFLRLLTTKEQTLLFALVISSLDLDIDFLCKNDYSGEIESLKNKRLIIFRGTACSVHDKYKPFFITYPIENSVFCKSINILKGYAKSHPEQYFDIIKIYIDRMNSIEAWKVLSENFKTILHCQRNTQFLNLIQSIENNNFSTINTGAIIFKKIILLERLGEYQLCLDYISLLDLSLFSLEEQISLLYINMRALYFTNKYDELLNLFITQSDNIFLCSSYEIVSQILSIVGRVYYVRGLLKGALACYLLSYQYAFERNEKTLEAKMIHRIAMVECCYGLISDSRTAFESLEKNTNYITPKRKSYIYYRISKCLLMEGQLDEAKNYNKKSIKIKESYSDKRGLVFSNKLEAKIHLAGNDYMDAVCSIKQAKLGAEEIAVDKEWLACTLVEIKTMLELNDNNITKEFCSENLQKCLEIATKDKLLYRLQMIQKISEGMFKTIYQSAYEQHNILFEELYIEETKIINFCIDKMTTFIKNIYYLLIIEQKCITRQLLIRSGFIELISP